MSSVFPSVSLTKQVVVTGFSQGRKTSLTVSNIIHVFIWIIITFQIDYVTCSLSVFNTNSHRKYDIYKYNKFKPSQFIEILLTVDIIFIRWTCPSHERFIILTINMTFTILLHCEGHVNTFENTFNNNINLNNYYQIP